MGKYDKEVGQAKKLVEQWLKESRNYHDQLIELKKKNLASEKEYVEKARKLLDGRNLENEKKVAEDVAFIVESGRKNLDRFLKAGEVIFETHNKWAMNGPRKGFVTMAAKLNFGKPGETRYEGILKELGTSTLEQVSKGLRETETAWKRDVKFAIETQQTKLEAIGEELRKGSVARGETLAKQMEKEKSDFKRVAEEIVGSVFFLKDKDDFNSVKNGQMEEVAPSQRLEKYKQYKNKIEVIANRRGLLEKNLGRVRKSFPQDFLDGAGKKAFEEITKTKESALFELTRYTKYYLTLIQLFEQKGWKP
ncbi:MAG: hypothetical protein JNN08_28930 [Bryobacterales bacterium]|nr:hypothetical protein [Bryobacterales bacterium]